MGWAGKGPGIGWSRAQPKYSWEANLYATRWFCADRKLNGVKMENNNIANCVNIFACVHLTVHYSHATSLWKGVPALRCHVQNMSNASELRQAVIEWYFRNSSWLWNYCTIKRKVILSNVKQKCGPLPLGSAVNLNKLNLIEIELFIKMLYGVWSSLQPDHETNKSPRRMQVSPPARNDDRSPIWNIWRPLISFLFRG